MKRTTIAGSVLLVFLCFFLSAASAQTCAGCRYITPVYDSVTVETVQFGEGDDALGVPTDLFMDVYQPHGDTAAIRPVVIFAFGGGFIQGHRQEGYVVKACERFAKSGYVAASIDYRIGFDPFGLLNPTEELMQVFFRAMQDMRASLQYMNAHADSMGNAWRIDTSMIFLGGASAGAITALMVTHCDKSTEFEEINSLGAISGMGGFNSTSGFYANRRYDNIAGVFNIAGALVNADWIEPGDPPILSAHGDQDNTVPFAGGNFNLGIAQLGLEGSFLVDEEAKAEGVCSFLFTMVGEGHPSGSASEAYFDQIFHRILPRMHALVHGRSFCCSFDLAVDPATDNVTTFQPGATVHLDAVATGVSPSAAYQWCAVPCDFSAQTSGVDMQPDSGDYAIAVVIDGGCQATDFTLLHGETSVAALAPHTESFATVYPNPARDRLYIHFPDANGTYDLRLHDVTGRLVHASQSRGGADAEIPLAEAGVYLLEISGKNGRYTTRVVVQK